MQWAAQVARCTAALALSLGCAVGAGAEPSRFTDRTPAGVAGQALVRDALAAPLRYRVIVVPGSGCEPLATSADRMFAGLLHAQVVLLQKPLLGVALPGVAATCSSAFVQADALSAWADVAVPLSTALAGPVAQAATVAPSLPLVLVGLSEGAELLPRLAWAFPDAVLLVMVAHAGLDPAEAGRLQARRLGAEAEWNALMARVRRPEPAGSPMIEGRSWRYWHDLAAWPLEAPLLADPRPLLHAWSASDALIPEAAYTQFSQRAQRRAGGYCAMRFEAVDHQLRSAEGDRLQSVWAALEDRARSPAGWRIDCAAPGGAPAAAALAAPAKK
jgi:hypothetical protein